MTWINSTCHKIKKPFVIMSESGSALDRHSPTILHDWLCESGGGTCKFGDLEHESTQTCSYALR